MTEDLATTLRIGYEYGYGSAIIAQIKMEVKNMNKTLVQNMIDFYPFLEDTVIKTVVMKDDAVSVIVPQEDGERAFEPPACILLNERLENDPSFENKVWECFKGYDDELRNYGCGAVDACLVYTLLELNFGHASQNENHTIDIERINSYVGEHVMCYVDAEFYALMKIKASAIAAA